MRPAPTIEKLVTNIRRHLYDAQTAETRCTKHRLAAGQLLLELRKRIEAGEAGDGVNWWEWYEEKFSDYRSRRDAERLMAMARSDDPEAALEADRSAAREGMRRHRAATNVSRKEHDVTPELADPVQEDDLAPGPEWGTPEQRWQLSLSTLAGEAISLQAYWAREFGEWEKFGMSSDLPVLAQQAADAWTEIAAHLEDGKEAAPLSVNTLDLEIAWQHATREQRRAFVEAHEAELDALRIKRPLGAPQPYTIN